jgi:hypothetical protein
MGLANLKVEEWKQGMKAFMDEMAATASTDKPAAAPAKKVQH